MKKTNPAPSRDAIGRWAREQDIQFVAEIEIAWWRSQWPAVKGSGKTPRRRLPPRRTHIEAWARGAIFLSAEAGGAKAIDVGGDMVAR